jgi:hypothetical protein
MKNYNPLYNHNLNKKFSINKGQPSNLKGKDGDHLICMLSKGLSLCFKIDGKWKELGHFKEINSKENKLKLHQLNIGNNTINASNIVLDVKGDINFKKDGNSQGKWVNPIISAMIFG